MKEKKDFKKIRIGDKTTTIIISIMFLIPFYLGLLNSYFCCLFCPLNYSNFFCDMTGLFALPFILLQFFLGPLAGIIIVSLITFLFALSIYKTVKKK